MLSLPLLISHAAKTAMGQNAKRSSAIAYLALRQDMNEPIPRLSVPSFISKKRLLSLKNYVKEHNEYKTIKYIIKLGLLNNQEKTTKITRIFNPYPSKTPGM